MGGWVSYSLSLYGLDRSSTHPPTHPPTHPTYLMPEVDVELAEEPFPNVIDKAVDARNARFHLLALWVGRWVVE